MYLRKIILWAKTVVDKCIEAYPVHFEYTILQATTLYFYLLYTTKSLLYLYENNI